MTDAELHELAFLALGQVDANFQFWLSITFATILVGYLAQSQLTRGLTLLVTFLYLLATFLILMRFDLAGDMYVQYTSSISELPFPTDRTENFTFIRGSILACGTVSAVVYLWIAYFKGRNSQ